MSPCFSLLCHCPAAAPRSSNLCPSRDQLPSWTAALPSSSSSAQSRGCWVYCVWSGLKVWKLSAYEGDTSLSPSPIHELGYLPVSCEHREEEPVRWDLSVTSLPTIPQLHNVHSRWQVFPRAPASWSSYWVPRVCGFAARVHFCCDAHSQWSLLFLSVFFFFFFY